MRHTAGFAYGAGPTPAHDAFVAADPLALTNTLAEASRRIGGLPLLFQPGTRWSYSAAVDVQAALVERLSGERFADHVRAHILEPLKMVDTAWRQPRSEAHTSELQSLMRISYAVFCLNKKTNSPQP